MSLDNQLRTVTYVSQAKQPFAEDDFQRLGVEAARLNALDGITGLLVYNGTSFCQTIEGFGPAIDDLIGRLRRDPRHSGFTVLSEEVIENRRFRSWDMQLLSVPGERDDAMARARARFSEPSDESTRNAIYRTVAGAFHI